MPLAMDDGIGGYLQVPPDRSHILGRQLWKTRYVTVGLCQTTVRDRQGSHTFSLGPPARGSSSSSKPAVETKTYGPFLSVYKAKEDSEPFQQWPLRSVSDCQVQQTSHRKQGPVLPTLVITISDHHHKRRSSRAASFMSTNKDSSTTTLSFRTPPDDHHRSLHDWARVIMASKGAFNAIESPVSPVFTSPFQSRSNDGSEHASRPISDNRCLHHKSSTATHSTGPLDRPTTFSSYSPSLRSRRSDLSSPSEAHHPGSKIPYAIPEQHYTTILPGDILTSGSPDAEHHGRFIEGWTLAQGRSSTMSSLVRGRDSVSSQGQQSSIPDVTSPPAPGETILDRAFQLGHIPGAGPCVPGQENIGSIARFDALMREVEGKQRRDTSQQTGQSVICSAFDEDDSSDEEDSDQDQSDSASDRDAHSLNRDQKDQGGAPIMSESAQRALAFIMNRHDDSRAESHRPTGTKHHITIHAGTVPTSPLAPPSRPHTAHAKCRPNAARSRSTLRMGAPAAATATTLDLPSSGNVSRDETYSSIADKRNSNSSSKRPSFAEFTKRLSSTSSLLLVQTNASAGSSHGGSEAADMQANAASPRTDSGLRGGPLPSRARDREEQDRRCGWRGNIGVTGAEGGFL